MQTPHIILGIPGRWTDRTDIVAAIAQRSEGFICTGTVLYNTATRDSYHIDVYDHDPALARAFALAGRHSLTETDLRLIADHTYTLYIIGNGGSPDAARRMMQAAAGILRAGGLAVKIETTGKAHSISDWMALANAQEPAALYRAYVTLIEGNDSFYSCGMHNLGLPDAIVAGKRAPGDAATLLETFLLYLLLEQPRLRDGHTFSVDTDAPRYKLRHVTCTLYDRDDPFYNPYGMWQLSKL